ncbi:hypothetical protein [Metallibacterium sp.]|uniref:hypothetical protein n=1 Tax=Metallibacterium sp. TaxID=2940281 RepID=UPI002603C1CB|nr:hypothetical protein [Metallibacterium sp.]
MHDTCHFRRKANARESLPRGAVCLCSGRDAHGVRMIATRVKAQGESAIQTACLHRRTAFRHGRMRPQWALRAVPAPVCRNHRHKESS